MSAGGVFKLIANDGKADRMIMATELLNQRIKDVMCLRYKQGYADTTPTLVDIERTHILFVNAHYKPFAALGYEYNKTRTNSGMPTFGGSVQFSIPQFGDFFHDMVIHVNLDPVSCNVAPAGGIPAFPAYIGTADQNVSALQSTSATSSGTSGGTYTKYTYQYVGFDGTVLNQATATAQNFVRYCEYPGERLFKHVKFEVNGNPLDEYYTEAQVFNRKFRVSPGKLIGYKRLTGQEAIFEAISGLMNISGQSQWPAEALAVSSVTAAPAQAAPQLATDTARRLDYVLNGYQTPKLQQIALDMWIPLLFWFNRDCRLAIPSVAIPYGQRFITVDIELQSNLLYAAAGNVFLQLTTEVWAVPTGTPAKTSTAVTSYRRYVTRQAVMIPTSVPSTTQTINTFDLYINNIFVNPEIHDIYIKRIGFSLIRVYRLNTSNQTTSSYDVLLAQLKWPIETMYAGFRPTYNITNPTYASSGLVSAGDPNTYRDWHRFTLLTDNNISETVPVVLPLASGGWASATPDTTSSVGTFAGAAPQSQSSTKAVDYANYTVLTKTLATIKITAHGINIYDQYNAEFFSDYIPYQYGGYNIVTPDDTGCVMINFNLYPGTYQPSGHLNVSRAREFYFSYTSNVCSTSQPCDLIVYAICVNFLLISDGSAVLRYST